MWRLDADGSAEWRDGDHVWTLRIGGGPIGIRLAKGDRVASRSSDGSRSDGSQADGSQADGSQADGDGVSLFSIGPAGSDRFPDLGEAFVRGDELHLGYPQVDGAAGDGAYSVEVVCRVVESEVIKGRGGRLVTEWTISIQTSRLESHPMLDLGARGSRIRRLTPTDRLSTFGRGPGAVEAAPLSTGSREATGAREATELWEEVAGTEDADRGARRAAPITAVSGGEASVAVLLDPRDYPWTLDLSDDHGLRQRLFGDFLEKGVIRKARPWVVVDEIVGGVEPRAGGVEQTADAGGGGEGLNESSALVRRWHELCRTPLPLTA